MAPRAKRLKRRHRAVQKRRGAVIFSGTVARYEGGFNAAGPQCNRRRQAGRPPADDRDFRGRTAIICHCYLAAYLSRLGVPALVSGMPADIPHNLGEGALPRKFAATQRASAFGVHIFTASGAAVALLATIAAVQGRWMWMFSLLAIALVIDALDGPLARKINVVERLPDWSGESLDFVVDYVTYVFLPGYAIAMGGLLPDAVAIPLGALIVVTGALYFADRRMKTLDNYFRGFPGVWNAPAFYLFLLRPDPWIAAAAIILLAILTFVPIPFLHPFRVRRLRVVNALLIVAWSGLAVVALVRDMSPGPWVTGALCAIAVYFLGAGLLRCAEAE